MLVLASKSPRRKELVAEYITTNFKIVPSNAVEKINPTLSIKDNILNIAKIKGDEVYANYPNDLILSADTVVILNNTIFGKPKNLLDAHNMLSSLSGNTHQVLTAYYIKSKEIEISNYVVSNVTFKKLNDATIERYISTNKVLDKAGSYGIQDANSDLIIDHYEGSLSNIIGLPIEAIKKDLKGLKIQKIIEF